VTDLQDTVAHSLKEQVLPELRGGLRETLAKSFKDNLALTELDRGLKATITLAMKEQGLTELRERLRDAVFGALKEHGLHELKRDTRDLQATMQDLLRRQDSREFKERARTPVTGYALTNFGERAHASSRTAWDQSEVVGEEALESQEAQRSGQRIILPSVPAAPSKNTEDVEPDSPKELDSPKGKSSRPTANTQMVPSSAHKGSGGSVHGGTGKTKAKNNWVTVMETDFVLESESLHEVMANLLSWVRAVEGAVTHLVGRNTTIYYFLTVLMLLMNLLVATCSSMAEAEILTSDAAAMLTTLLGGIGALVLTFTEMGQFHMKASKYGDALNKIQQIHCKSMALKTVTQAKNAVKQHDPESMMNLVQKIEGQLNSTIADCEFPISVAGEFDAPAGLLSWFTSKKKQRQPLSGSALSERSVDSSEAFDGPISPAPPPLQGA